MNFREDSALPESFAKSPAQLHLRCDLRRAGSHQRHPMRLQLAASLRKAGFWHTANTE